MGIHRAAGTFQLRNRGFLIAAGRCYEAEQSVPYYPFLDALSAAYAAAPAQLQRDAARRWPYLSILLPNHLSVQEVAGGGQEEQRLFFAVASFVEAIAELMPVAILLDDLHWADPAALKLLLHLARHTRSSRVFMLGAYRNVEISRRHPLEGTLHALDREGLMRRLAVRRLDQEGTAALMASTMGEEEISDEFAGLVYGRTEGNPFFVQQVMRTLVERGDIYREDGRWERKAVEAIQVPESVRSVIGQRLERLREETQAAGGDASTRPREKPSRACRNGSVNGERPSYRGTSCRATIFQRRPPTPAQRLTKPGLSSLTTRPRLGIGVLSSWRPRRTISHWRHAPSSVSGPSFKSSAGTKKRCRC